MVDKIGPGSRITGTDGFSHQWLHDLRHFEFVPIKVIMMVRLFVG